MGRFLYTAEMDSFIVDHREGRSLPEAVEAFNFRFDTQVTVSAMRSKYKALGIRVGLRRKVFSDIWPKDVVAFLEENNEGRSSREMADLLNLEFGTFYTEGQIRAYRKNHHLPCGRDTRFRPGCVSPTKGMRQADFIKDPDAMRRAASTRFRPGHRPHNWVPVGTELEKSDGYIWRKVAEPSVWRQKHILVWEETHGPLPDGMLVTFLDGDRRDFDADNLMAVTLEENAHLLADSVRDLGDRDLTRAQALTWRLGKALEDIHGKD